MKPLVAKLGPNGELNLNQLLDLQQKQYQKCIVINGVVGATSAVPTLTATKLVTSEGPFLLQRITSQYSTLVTNGAGGAWDDGTCHLRALIRDNSNGIMLFDDYVSMSLFSTPGRQRTIGVGLQVGGVFSADRADNMHISGFPFEYIFKGNSEITVDLKNDSTYPNTFELAFWGIKIRNPETNSNGPLIS